MIAILLNVHLARPRLASLIPTEHMLRIEITWEAFESAALRADIAIMLVERVWEDPFPSRIKALRARLGSRPLIVITRREVEIARALASVQLTELLWLDELERFLPAAVRRAAIDTSLVRIGSRIDDMTQLPPPFAKGIAIRMRDTSTDHHGSSPRPCSGM